VAGGRVFILSDRDIYFSALKPTAPEFQLAGDSERVAMTCAALGVRADELDLPVPLDKVAYRNALALLEQRGIVEKGRLTRYGKLVEAMPVERPWAELLVNADDELIPFLAVMASIESLHRMTRDERDLDGVTVPGSDHLTAYNLYAESFETAGTMGEVYGLPRHLFDEQTVDEWAERRGVLVKSIEDAALGMASIYRAVGLPLPDRMPNAGESVLARFQQLLAEFMPFSLVIDEETASGEEVRVSKTSVAGSWGAIAGDLRYFADKMGVPRASIEGTNIPMALIRRYATESEPELVFEPSSKRAPLVLRRRVSYHGVELEREVEPIDAIPPELLEQARGALAEGLARGEARHLAAKNDRVAIEEIRESWRRSGGKTPKLGAEELAAIYRKQLANQNVRSFSDFRRARLGIDAESILPRRERERYLALPDFVEIRGREIQIRYDVEESPEGPRGVASLTLPEKIARTLAEQELPALDRPLRFVVTRGQRGAARADTLEELRDELDRPFTDKEIEALDRAVERKRASAGEHERRRGPRTPYGRSSGAAPRVERNDRGVKRFKRGRKRGR
jgi:hypothetical protein